MITSTFNRRVWSKGLVRLSWLNPDTEKIFTYLISQSFSYSQDIMFLYIFSKYPLWGERVGLQAWDFGTDCEARQFAELGLPSLPKHFIGVFSEKKVWCRIILLIKLFTK